RQANGAMTLMSVNGQKVDLRVLIVEDDESDAILLVEALRRAGYKPEWTRVEDEESFRARLTTNPDVIITDYHLPRFSILRALAARDAHDPNIPLLVVSGSVDASEAVEAIRRGASDYLPKSRLDGLGAALARALEQRHAIEAVRASAE